MGRNLQNILLVSAATFLSRVLGLVRDVLAFAAFGTSALHSAFILAFTLPNLFRRLLGEGALNSAMIPVFSSQLEHEGREGAFRFLNRVLTRATLLLLALTALGMVLLYFLSPAFEDGSRWKRGAELGIIMLPYMPLVCLAAAFAAALNVLERFGMAALSAVWLNCCMIAAQGAGILWARGELGRVYWLCVGVLVGGVIQLVTPAWSLWKEGWRPKWDLAYCPQVQELIQIFLPGVLGAAIGQINTVVSRCLAFWLNESAVAVLYLANRLLELPLGMFTIAVTTVIFPGLARLSAKQDREGLERTWQQGLRLILAITVPAGLGLIVLQEPILQLLFEWGRFQKAEVAQTGPILMIFGLSIPFYSLSIFATRAFHSLKDTRTPVKVAGMNFLANILFSVALMFPFGTAGLALANLLSVALQTVALGRLLVKKEPLFGPGALGRPCIQIGIASVIMAAVTALGWAWVLRTMGPGKQTALLGVGLIAPAIGLYFGVLWALKFEDRAEFISLLKKLFRKKQKAGNTPPCPEAVP